MKKIGTVTIARDSRRYIIPHLNMYKGLQNHALFVDSPIIGGSVGHKGPDDTEELIRKYCPDVEIHHTDVNKWGADLFNTAAELVKDCDVTVMLHADVVMDKENRDKFFRILQDTDYDVYNLDMPKCTINHYLDFDHGLRDCLDIEPVAYKSDVRFTGYYGTFNKSIYNIEDITVHHFTGWKGDFLDKEYVDKTFGKQDWLSVPDEVKSEIKKYWNEDSV